MCRSEGRKHSYCYHIFTYLQIRYTGFRERPIEERQVRFLNGCRSEGRTEIAFVASGTNLQLTFNQRHAMSPYGHERDCDFDKEHDKVSDGIIRSYTIYVVVVGIFSCYLRLFWLLKSSLTARHRFQLGDNINSRRQ